jgi:hypothetical protein
MPEDTAPDFDTYVYPSGRDTGKAKPAPAINPLPSWSRRFADKVFFGNTLRRWLELYTAQGESKSLDSLPSMHGIRDLRSHFLACMVDSMDIYGEEVGTGIERSLCLTPKPVKDGDWICILFGCPVPVVLRPMEGGEFELVSDCYIEGAMSGEAMAMLEHGEYEKQRFVIV